MNILKGQFKARHDFLWFKEGQVVNEIQDNWAYAFKEEVKPTTEKEVITPIIEVKEDKPKKKTVVKKSTKKKTSKKSKDK